MFLTVFHLLSWSFYLMCSRHRECRVCIHLFYNSSLLGFIFLLEVRVERNL